MKRKTVRINWMKALPFGLALLSLFHLSCKDQVDSSDIYTFTAQTISDYVDEDSTLSMFNIVLQKSKVSNNARSYIKALMSARGNYTIFVPTNDAMRVYLDSVYGSKEWNIDTMSEGVANTIAQNCIIDYDTEEALQTTAMEVGAIVNSTLNDRHIMVSFDTLEGGKFTVILNGKSHITTSDVKLSNGYLNVVDAVLSPSTATLSALIEMTGNLHIFSLILNKTSWADSMLLYRDEVYENTPTKDKQNEAEFKYTTPPHRYYGFMAFVETDSVFNAEWGIPLPVYSGGFLTNEKEILAAIEEKCKAAYPAATSSDWTSQNNAVNQFVSYHLVPFKEAYNQLIRHADELGYNTALPEVLPMDLWTYFHAMGKPNRLFKITQTCGDAVYHINRMSYHNNAFDGDMKETSVVDPGITISPDNGQYENNALNGYYYPIDKVMLYTDFTRDAVLNERIRYDMAQYLGEMMSNDIRTNTTKTPHYFIPHNPYPYCENLLNKKADTDYRTPINAGASGWCGIESDQFAFSNNFDVTFKLMPVPFAGTWEVRYLVSNLASRGLAQGYFGTNPDNLVATGLPFDFRLLGTNPRVGSNVVAANVTQTDGDSVLAIENDRQMRNHMYMKGCKTYCKNYFNQTHAESQALRYRAESLRLIVYRGYMEPDKTYYLRFKTLLTNPTAYLFGDAFELCPKTVWDNPERSEDIW